MTRRWIVDFISSAKISDFEYRDDSFTFQTDSTSPITIYMSRTILPNYGFFTVNGEIQNDVKIQSGLEGNYVKIDLTPEEYGVVSLKSAEKTK